MLRRGRWSLSPLDSTLGWGWTRRRRAASRATHLAGAASHATRLAGAASRSTRLTVAAPPLSARSRPSAHLDAPPRRQRRRARLRPAVPQMEKPKGGKANWDSAAHTIFMNVCVEEVHANHRSGTTLSEIGQANLVRKFNERSRRNYSQQQIKNRWDACRHDYNIWKTLIQKASGIGRDDFTKTISATDEWWALELKAHPPAAKFRYAPLAEEDKMREVFDACCVTNEHARVPTPTYQGPSQVNLDDDSGYEGEDAQVTPSLTRAKGGKKRACPYSPSPKMNEKWASETAKNEAFVRMVDIFDARQKRAENQSANLIVDPTRQEIQDMMAMVEADGAEPGSDEHFYASHLLLEQKYHDVFTSFKGHEPSVRLGWLRRTWELNNK